MSTDPALALVRQRAQSDAHNSYVLPGVHSEVLSANHRWAIHATRRLSDLETHAPGGR